MSGDHGTTPHTRRIGDTLVEVVGSGPPLVLIHGVGLDLRIWDAQVAAFAARHTVVRYDMLGHGGSALPPQDVELDHFVVQLTRLLDALDIRRADVVGFSMGGLVAMGFALAQADRLDRLGIVASVYQRTEAERAGVMARLAMAESEGPSAIIAPALERWFTPAWAAANPAAVQAVRRRLEANDRRGFVPAYRVFATAGAGLDGAIGAIRAPTLVVAGAEDTGSTPRMARAMADAIPDSRVVVLAGLRHMVPVEGAEALNATLTTFLDAEPGAPG